MLLLLLVWIRVAVDEYLGKLSVCSTFGLVCRRRRLNVNGTPYRSKKNLVHVQITSALLSTHSAPVVFSSHVYPAAHRMVYCKIQHVIEVYAIVPMNDRVGTYVL